jgi:hypothetical protein
MQASGLPLSFSAYFQLEIKFICLKETELDCEDGHFIQPNMNMV